MDGGLLSPIGSRDHPFQVIHEWAPHRALEAVAHVWEHPRRTEFDVHAGLEVGVVLRGEEVRTFPDGTERRFRPGEVWLHPMWEVHGVRIAEADTHVVIVMFLPELLGDQLLGDLPWLTLFCAPAKQRPWVTEERTRRRVLDLGQHLWQEIDEQALGWSTSVQLWLVQLLLELRRGWVQEGASGYARDLSLVLPAITALHGESARWVSLSEAAALSRLSRPYFSRLFRRCTGLSFHRFLLRTRTAQAAERLRYSQVSVEAAATEFGFVDGSHLHRHFVKLYGCTPAEYRRQNRHRPERAP